MPSRNNAPAKLDVDWHVAHGSVEDGDRENVLARLPHLERAVRDFPVTRVHIEIDNNQRRGEFGVSVNLQLPARSLFAAEWDRDIGVAGRRAMNKVISQVGTYRAMLRRHERRNHRRELPPAPAPQVTVDPSEHAGTLEGLRDRVARLVRHEIVHDTDLAGLPKEAISVPDVVDEAMVWTLENLGNRPAYLSPEQFLWRRVIHQMDLAKASVLRRRAAEEENARGKVTREGPADYLDVEWQDAEDLIYGGGEPLPLDRDEASREDSDPTEILDREAAQQAVSEALRDLPERQRRALLLHDLEGYDPSEIAFVLARSEDRIREDIEEARITLRGKLRRYE